MLRLIITFLAMVAMASMQAAAIAAPQSNYDCPAAEVPTTKPKPVDLDEVLRILATIRNDKNEAVYTVDNNQALRNDLANNFDPQKVPTKMGQFYGMLFIIQEHSPLPKGVQHTISGKPVRDLLLSTGVFPDPSFPEQINHVHFRRSSLTPYYEVEFSDRSIEFQVNKGAGFRAWQNGKCQHAKALMFMSPFSFYLQKHDKGDLIAYKFKNVDITGDFGTRGFLDVDLNFVSLISVQFLRNSPLGLVKARVSPKEFEVNKHSWLLKVVTNFFSDTSKQAIDW